MGTQPLVLVADDEPRITKLVSIALTEEGFRVVTATGGEDALAKAEEVRPDIVLLDIVMPDLDGIEVMRQLREQRPVPVILLTAKGATADKAKGLDLGADDYIAKPFHPDELAARVRAVIRRSSGVEPGAGVLAFDDIEIDLERRMVRRNGELVQLSRTEWLLLQHLATHPGKVVLHTELLTKVWGPEYRDDLQYLRVWISRVRRKLGAKPGEPGRIKTFQGIGYLLDVEPGGGSITGDGTTSDRRHRHRRDRDRRPRQRPSADLATVRPRVRPTLNRHSTARRPTGRLVRRVWAPHRRWASRLIGGLLGWEVHLMTYDEKTVVHRDDYVDGGTAVTSRTVEARPSGGTIAGRIVILLFGIVQVLILLRIVFLLLDAREANDLVAWILNASQIFVAPFEGMLGTNAVTSGGSVLDVAAILALIGWSLLEVLILAAVGVFRREPAAA